MIQLETNQRRAIGSTGLRVSPLGLGTVKFGRNTDVKYPQPFELPSDQQLKSLIALAHDLGINLIDTAPAYGSSEQRLGKLLKQTRQQWVICTKVGEQYGKGQSLYDYSASKTRESIENSLSLLKTDYLDIVLIHSDGNDEQILNETDVVPELIRLRDKGLIRCLGASTKTVAGGLLAIDMLDLAMVEYHPDNRSQEPVLMAAKEKNKGIIVKKALASGHASSMSKNLTFILDHTQVNSVIVGTINAEHLKENISSVIG